MRDGNIRCQRLRASQIQPVAVEMYCRENASPVTVRYSERAVRRCIRFGHVWIPMREPVPHISSMEMNEIGLEA